MQWPIEVTYRSGGADADGRATVGDAVRITAVEAIPFALPYRRRPEFASGSVTSADNVLVRVHTDAGLVGQAEAQPRPYTYGETQASIVDGGQRSRSTHALAGLDPLRIERVAERCAAVAGNYVARGRGRPRRLGPDRADPRAPLPHAARRVRRRRRGRAHGVVRRAGRDGRRGGRGQRAARRHDVQGESRPRRRRWTSPRCERSATALPDADLYVDANRGWSYDDAARAGDALAELGVRAIEEPISIEDRAGRLRLARALDGAAGRR